MILMIQFFPSISETDEPAGVNIGGLTLHNDSKILLLAPHFRLLRVLHYKQNDGHLEGIDALLGCPIIMPNVDIDELDSDQSKQVADCLFHGINWFREVLSAFITHKDRDLRNKVVHRVKVITVKNFQMKTHFFSRRICWN